MSKSKRLNIGLQFFADEAANADAVIDTASEGVADPQPAEPTVEVVETSQPEQKPEVDQTKAFAERLKAKTAEIEAKHAAEMDAFVSRMWGSQGIHTYADLLKAEAEQKAAEEAQKQNIPVEIYKEWQETKTTAQQAVERLKEYERREAMVKESEKLSSDPVWGDFYTANKDEIHAIAEESGVTLDVAKLLVLDKKGIPKVDETKLKEQAVKDYLESVRKGNRPVESNGPAPVVVPSSPKTFEEARQASLAYLRALNQS